MSPSVLREIESTTDTLCGLTYRLIESFYEENQIFLAKERIAKLRAGIDRERERITRLRTVLHRRREQEKDRESGR